MFDELIRELRKLEQPRRVSISLALDERGFLDRVCPSERCSGLFKVLFDDWRDKVPEERAFCPFCRHEAEPDDWNTSEQQRYIKEVAHAEMSRLVNDAFGRAARRTPTKRIGGGLFDITMKLSFRPGRIPLVVPAAASEELRQDFTCEACRCRYASLGASFFCPACGHNSATSCFDNTLETVGKTVGALRKMRDTLAAEVNADVASDAVRQLLEDQLPRLVGAFERLNEALFEKLPNASQFPRTRGVFQRLDDASGLWQQATGKGYGDFLSPSELGRLKVLYQRRHVVAHRQGIIDQDYMDRSGDRSYAIGQRLIVREADVADLVRLLAQVASGLRGLV